MIKPYYQDPSITIYHADALELVNELGELAEKPKLVLSDPPYSSGARRDADKQTRGSMTRALEDTDWFSHDTMTAWGFGWFIRGLFVRLLRHLEGGSHVYVFSDWRQAPNVMGLLESCGYRVNHRLIWDKRQFGMGTYWRNQHEEIVFASKAQPLPMLRADMGSVLTVNGVHHASRVYPTEKPVPLMRKIIEAVPGDLILDPFCGSGPVLQAAKEAGRRAIGVDIDEEACEIAARRCRQEVFAFA